MQKALDLVGGPKSDIVTSSPMRDNERREGFPTVPPGEYRPTWRYHLTAPGFGEGSALGEKTRTHGSLDSRLKSRKGARPTALLTSNPNDGGDVSTT